MPFLVYFVVKTQYTSNYLIFYKNCYFYSLSDSECVECKENRKLNLFNKMCECNKGFKEDMEGNCRKCY